VARLVPVVEQHRVDREAGMEMRLAEQRPAEQHEARAGLADLRALPWRRRLGLDDAPRKHDQQQARRGSNDSARREPCALDAGDVVISHGSLRNKVCLSDGFRREAVTATDARPRIKFAESASMYSAGRADARAPRSPAMAGGGHV